MILIDQQEAAKQIRGNKEYVADCEWLKGYNKACEDNAQIIEGMKGQESVKGHWIEITSRNHTYKCSVCGRLLVNITDGKNNVAKNYPYCHCGADMRGGVDGRTD